MKGIPYGRYTKEFREEAVELVTEGKMSIPDTTCRLSDNVAAHRAQPKGCGYIILICDFEF